MAKFLLLIGVALLVFWVLKGYRRRIDDERQEAQPPAQGEDMVRCARCGVHLPRSESIISEGRFFCSDEHRRLHGD